MGDAWTRLFVHLTWATWDRAPLITPAIEQELHALMAGECRTLKCEAFGSVGSMIMSMRW
jgi:hypothetical protein